MLELASQDNKKMKSKKMTLHFMSDYISVDSGSSVGAIDLHYMCDC